MPHDYRTKLRLHYIWKVSPLVFKTYDKQTDKRELSPSALLLHWFSLLLLSYLPSNQAAILDFVCIAFQEEAIEIFLYEVSFHWLKILLIVIFQNIFVDFQRLFAFSDIQSLSMRNLLSECFHFLILLALQMKSRYFLIKFRCIETILIRELNNRSSRRHYLCHLSGSLRMVRR